MSNNQPVLIAYSVRERDGKKSIYTKIGACFKHATGAGMTINLDALPIGNSIVLFEPKEDKTKTADNGGAQ